MLKNRLPLIFIVALPLLGIVAAWVAFSTGIGLPQGYHNRGILIAPAVDLKKQMNFIATNLAEAPHWTMVINTEGDCGEDCKRLLYLSRQVRTALADDSWRVKRVLLEPETAEKKVTQNLLREHPDLQFIQVSDNVLAQSSDILPQQSAKASLLLVDPRGFAMMYYTNEHNGADMLEDLEFLLRYDRVTGR